MKKIIISIIFCISVSLYAEDFSIDTDHDGFPDLLEKSSGFDPFVNQPLAKGVAGGRCGEIKNDFLSITKPDTTLIVLDISGSMSESIGAETKIDLAKKILNKLVDSMPASMNVGVVIYGKTGCEDDSIELLIPIGGGNKKAIKDAINALQPSGSTPIAKTIDKAPEFLKGYEGGANNLILISDGQESCGGDPVDSIKKFKASEYNPQVTVIGLDVDPSTRLQLSKIADASQGVYSDVKDEKDLVKAFSSFFDQMNKGYKDIVCIVSQYNTYLTEESLQFDKSRAWIIKANIKAKTDADKQALADLDAKLIVNHDARIKAKDELSKKISNRVKEMEDAKKAFTGEAVE